MKISNLGVVLGVMVGAALMGQQQAEAAALFFPGTGNYYDFIPGTFTWDEARAEAESQTFMGLTGHLATLTSLEEDQFIRENFSEQVNQFVGPWFGADWDGSGFGPIAGWSWVTDEVFGPHVGWNPLEPNHLQDFEPNQPDGEDAVHFSGGGWNDISRDRTDTSGYFVEFEAAAPETRVPEPATILGIISTIGFATLLQRKQY